MRTSFFGTKNIILSCNNVGYVNIKSHNHYSYQLLVDTGASISVIKYKQILDQNIPIHIEKTLVNGIGGKVQAIGYAYLRLVIGNQTLQHKFYVFKTLPCKGSGILGQDFLSKYKSVLNYGNQTLLLWNNNSKVSLPLIMTNNHFNIPARSESIHFIRTCEIEECVVNGTELRKGIFVANTLVKPTNGKIPIRILNTTETDLVLTTISPTLYKASEYDVCSFQETNNNADRVRKVFASLSLKHLNKEEQLSIESICAKYADIFFLPGDKLGTTKLYEHSITLKPNVAPVYVKPYRMPHSQKAELKKQVDNLLEQEIIEPCSSEWSSPVLLVPKKSDANGEKKWRLVIDYRKLNTCIQDDKFPLPNITDILDSLCGCIYFTHLDLNQGFFNVALNKHSRKYTSFSADGGQYQMTRMPMGLKTSPSSFSRMMTMAMTGLSYDKCLVYLDDLICMGRNLTDHNKNLIEVFEKMRSANLKLNPTKCDFLKKEMLYLGHVVTGNGILPDPDKIKIIKEYPVPKSTDEVKRFVAFANYYRKFIDHFADKAYHLNLLSKKNTKFNWDSNCQTSFETLKQSMMSPPILQYPDFSELNQFIVQTDASGYAIGAVLSNSNGRPIAYASRSLNKAEKNYPTIEKELLAVVWAVKYFRPYLYGRTFKILTDHKPLVYLFNLKDPSSRLFKFRLALEEYNYEIEYVKGSENCVADALSRIKITSKELKEMNECLCAIMTRAQKRKLDAVAPEDELPTDNLPVQPHVVETHIKPRGAVELRFAPSSSLKKLKSDSSVVLQTHIILLYNAQMKTIFINSASQSQTTRAEFARELSDLCNKLNIEEVYFIKNSNNKIFVEKLTSEIRKQSNWKGPRLCILKDVERIEDKDDRKVILNDFHLLPTSGHAGMRRMLTNIKKYYFWPGLESDVKNYVKKCVQCQKHKYTVQVKEPMAITTTAHSAFDKIFLDLVGPLDKDSNNFSYILTLQCELSKYVCAYPLVTKTSTEVARTFVDNFILQHGIPREIATDRGTEFMSETVTQVCELLHIKKLNSTAYHHQSIGALENSHKNLGAFLRIQAEGKPELWSTWLPFWCFAYNTTVHSSTKFTPFELVYGRKCNLPNNLEKCVEPLYNYDSYPLELKYRLQVSQTEARENLIANKIGRKSRYDQHVNPIRYKPNDQVLIKNETGNKLQQLYSGPYKVIRDLSPNVEVNYKGKPDIIHKNRTKPYHV